MSLHCPNLNNTPSTGPLTEADFERRLPTYRERLRTEHDRNTDALLKRLHRINTFPACSGPCDQGRKPCPSPQACQVQVHRPPAGLAPLFGLCAISAVAVVAALAYIFPKIAAFIAALG